MEIRVQIDRKDLESVLSQHPTEPVDLIIEITQGDEIQVGEVSARSKKMSRTRLSNIREKQAIIRPPEEQELLDLWNNSNLVQRRGCKTAIDSRNKPVTPKEFPSVLPILKQGIRLIGFDALKSKISEYLLACERGKHVWDGKNHGFKNLGGLVSKLINYHKSGDIPWWMDDSPARPIVDAHPEMTQYIANEFSKEILRTAVLDLSDDKVSNAIIRAKELVVAVVDANVLPVSQPFEFLVGCIFKCIYKRRDSGLSVYPSSLSSRVLWTIELPQYFDQNLSITKHQIRKFSEVVLETFKRLS